MIRGPARARAFAHRKGASAGASPPATIRTAHACVMQTGAATRLAQSRNPQMDPLAPHLSAAVTGASFALATASRGRAPAAGERRARAAIAYNARVDRGGYDRTAAPSTERHASLARR